MSDDEKGPAATGDSVMDEHMARLIGKLAHARSRIGTYDIVRKLGAGGMGEVFAARHTETRQAVALKTLSSTTATRLYRFKREFRALADVDHRNLVRLYELVVPEEGAAFFTMELLDGRPLVAWVRGSTPTGMLPQIGRLEHALRQLAEGVHHLHSHGCVHRDLKPSNVLVTEEGRVVVLRRRGDELRACTLARRCRGSDMDRRACLRAARQARPTPWTRTDRRGRLRRSTASL